MSRVDGTLIKPYEGWGRTQAQLANRRTTLRPQEVRLQASADGWPIWAVIGHLAAARVCWLCDGFKEPGAETTPFR